MCIHRLALAIVAITLLSMPFITIVGKSDKLYAKVDVQSAMAHRQAALGSF
jgi:hypothetical protein